MIRKMLVFSIIAALLLAGCTQTPIDGESAGQDAQGPENYYPRAPATGNNTGEEKWVEKCTTYFEAYPHTIPGHDDDTLHHLNWTEIPVANRSSEIRDYLREVYHGENRSWVKLGDGEHPSWFNFTNFLRQWHPQGHRSAIQFVIVLEGDSIESNIATPCTSRPVNG